MTENNKWIKTAIIIVAVVVILESVVIITRQQPAMVKTMTGNSEPAKVLESKPNGLVELSVRGDTQEMKLKNSYKVWVQMDAKTNLNLDAVDLYVNYDKTAFTVSGLDFSEAPVKPTFSKISDTKSVVVVNYFVTEPAGMALMANEPTKLLGFTVTPKKVGDYEFSVSLGDENDNSKTLLVENTSSKSVPFNIQKLKVSVK